MKKYRLIRTIPDEPLESALQGLGRLWDQITGGSQPPFRTEFLTDLETLNHFQRDFPKDCTLCMMHFLEAKVLSRLRKLYYGNKFLLGLLPTAAPSGRGPRPVPSRCWALPQS